MSTIIQPEPVYANVIVFVMISRPPSTHLVLVAVAVGVALLLLGDVNCNNVT